MKKIIMILLSVMLVVGMAPTVWAAEDVIVPEEFDGIRGDGTINQSDQYYLDVADPGIMDTSGTMATNSFANGIFENQIKLVKMTCTLFYAVSSFDIVEAIRPFIEPAQTSFKQKLFDSLIILFIAFAFLGMAGIILKRNYPEILSRLTQFVVLCVMAALLSNHSMNIISKLNMVSDEICKSITESMSSSTSGENYSLTAVNSLWKSLIHEPWRMLEFDKYTPTDKDLEKELLDGTYLKGSDERQEKIDDINKDAKKSKKAYLPFNKSMPSSRVWFLMFYWVVLAPKCLLYIALAIVKFTFGIATILLILMGTIVLLLAVVPWFGGMKLVEKWGLQILQIQVLVCLLSFLSSFIIMIDNLTYLMAKAQFGWLLALILQVGLIVGLVWTRKQIFGFIFTTPKKLITQNSMDLTKIHASDVAGAAAHGVSDLYHSADHAMVNAGSGIYNKAAGAYNNMVDMGTNAYNNISGYFSSENTDNQSAASMREKPETRPSLDMATTPAAGEAAAPSATTDTPRPNLSDTRNPESGRLGASSVSIDTTRPNLSEIESPESGGLGAPMVSTDAALPILSETESTEGSSLGASMVSTDAPRTGLSESESPESGSVGVLSALAGNNEADTYTMQEHPTLYMDKRPDADEQTESDADVSDNKESFESERLEEPMTPAIVTALVGNNEADTYTMQEYPTLYVDERPETSEQTEAAADVSDNIVDYESLTHRPSLEDASAEPPKTSPARHNKYEPQQDTNALNKTQNARPVVADEPVFDMGSFEPNERVEKNYQNNKRPVLEDVS